MKTKCFGLLCAAMLLIGCKGSNQTATLDDDVVSDEIEENVNDDFFMLNDEKLPCKVDLTQDVSQLSYQNLRLLRSYVYATHGHWFMEGELNCFFSSHTDWYRSLCDSLWNSWYEDDDGNTQVMQYCDALVDDYESAFKYIKLSKAEEDFVAKIDARMEELMKHKSVKNAEGVELTNAHLAANWFQLYKPDDKLLGMLYKNNVAFSSTDYQQLFNVYENNEYLAMPSFVTTDLMLQAYHMYFSYVLKCIEQQELSVLLKESMAELLQQSCSNIKGSSGQTLETERWNAAFFIVALKLLDEDPNQLIEGGNLAAVLGQDIMQVVDSEIQLIAEMEDNLSPLFKTSTYFGYSLFKPRGHYTRKEETQRWFRAMMWLQKGCFMREDRSQLKQAVSMARLINSVPLAKKKLIRMDNALTFLMGEPDNVSIMELADWMEAENMNDINISTAQLNRVDKWLKEVFKGRNNISPKVKVGNQDQLNLMPQRYEIDNKVLATIYDPKPNADRAFPTGLDMMDAFGVKAATELLADYNRQQPWKDYDKEHKKLMKITNQFDSWDKTLYNKWLKSLVEMQKQEKTQPGFMKTHTWALKNLNTALGSWALLKHDAILYAEQPMAAECGGAGLPDPSIVGYVEPNMPFWKQMKEMIGLLRDMLEDNQIATDDLKEKSEQLEGYIDLCIRCSEKELAGEPLDKADADCIQHIGSSIEWFTLSVIDPEDNYSDWSDIKGADRCIAQVADVFTRNITNCNKDGILYEATGLANAIYVIVEINGLCYLTRGATYSYYEFVRPLGDRLTDEQWQEMIEKSEAPAQPDWFAPLVIGTSVDHDQRFVYSTGC